VNKVIANLVSVMLFAVLLAGCGTTSVARNRRADLHDVLNVKFHFMALGADANVGPANVGVILISGPDGKSLSLSRGITGTTETPYSGLEVGLGIPVSRIGYPPKDGWSGSAEYYSEKGERFVRERKSSYSDKYPGWCSIGFDLGIIVGIGFRFDVCEFADFIGNFFGKDILDDDHITPVMEYRK
jgi:hypothetical protein